MTAEVPGGQVPLLSLHPMCCFPVSFGTVSQKMDWDYCQSNSQILLAFLKNLLVLHGLSYSHNHSMLLIQGVSTRLVQGNMFSIKRDNIRVSYNLKE